jgi:hypothetical protein
MLCVRAREGDGNLEEEGQRAEGRATGAPRGAGLWAECCAMDGSAAAADAETTGGTSGRVAG